MKKKLLGEFKDTASYIGLYEPQQGVDKTTPEAQDSPDDEPLTLKVGDRVQWTSQGVDQFKDGAIVLGFSDDGEWVFTDQGGSGVPRSGVTLMNAAEIQDTRTPPPIPAHLLVAKVEQQAALREGWQEERLLDDSGGEIFIRYEGEVSSERYEFIRDYLDFKLSRLKHRP